MANDDDTKFLIRTASLMQGVELGTRTGRLEKSVEIQEREIEKLKKRVTFLECILYGGLFFGSLYAVINNWITLKELIFSLGLKVLRL